MAVSSTGAMPRGEPVPGLLAHPSRAAPLRPEPPVVPGPPLPRGASVVASLRARPPGLHGSDGREWWGLAWPALEWLERTVQPGMQTLETGSGSSTIVFAARGAKHEAITPAPDEERRVRAACAALEVPQGSVDFRLGPSHEVLARLPWRPLDLALIDGAHGFPYPLLDWWAISQRVRVGGVVLLDDAYMPTVGMVVDALRDDPSWAVEGAVGYRTVVVRRVDHGPPSYDWDGKRVGGRMSFRYLPPRRRVVALARHRFFSTSLGLALVAAVRRDAGLRWRRIG